MSADNHQEGAMATSVYDLELPDVDLFDLERNEASDLLAIARDEHWLARGPIGFMITHHADAVAILRERRFHSAFSMITEMAGVDDDYMKERRESILTMEGEEHTRLRRLVAGAFTPKSADRLRPSMRAVIGELVDALAPIGECELVEDICEMYPIAIICELLGAPKEDWKLFSNWATDIFRIFNNDLANDLPRIRAASDELDDYVRTLIAERRADPREDLLSDLIAAEEAGDRLSTDELLMLAEAVLMAGTDTTRNQLACSMALFAQHPDQWELLGQRPELAMRAVEESMRYLGAVWGTARIASDDIEYRDVVFPKGTLVAISLRSGNFDPDAWQDPDEFDIDRERSSVQLTFGSGIHFCLGANLARAELQEALAVMARRLGNLRLAGPIEWKPSGTGIWGPAKLPLSFETR